ncbi:uncharacterized protein IL334_007624 [Kwoniella shivajii]|uniref:BZIP domain-containing protein n=1 Tax=Kwoniella shivajii TaxID=564305 RepID=A0ABZ1DCB3_9TREE|nr:hypothetical protein IL334_007624 [Kwoniella shivajii]
MSKGNATCQFETDGGDPSSTVLPSPYFESMSDDSPLDPITSPESGGSIYQYLGPLRSPSEDLAELFTPNTPRTLVGRFDVAPPPSALALVDDWNGSTKVTKSSTDNSNVPPDHPNNVLTAAGADSEIITEPRTSNGEGPTASDQSVDGSFPSGLSPLKYYWPVGKEGEHSRSENTARKKSTDQQKRVKEMCSRLPLAVQPQYQLPYEYSDWADETKSRDKNNSFNTEPASTKPERKKRVPMEFPDWRLIEDPDQQRKQKRRANNARRARESRERQKARREQITMDLATLDSQHKRMSAHLASLNKLQERLTLSENSSTIDGV